MNKAISIVGKTPLAKQIINAFVNAGFRLDSKPKIVLICDWVAVKNLYNLDNKLSVPWFFIEDREPGHVSISPLFGTNTSGCFQCYIQRQCANGITEYRPVLDRILGNVQIQEIVNRVEVLYSELLYSDASMLGHSQTVISEDSSITRHTFLPLPNCCICQFKRQNAPRLNVDSLISDRIGIVHKVISVIGTPESLSIVKAIGCREDILIKRPEAIFNHGIAVDVQQKLATIRAVGESIERYCSAFFPHDLPFSYPQELGDDWLDPRHPNAVTSTINSSTLLRWTRAYSINNKKSVWVPASLVYLPYSYMPRETVLGVQSSNGLATGRSLDEAIEHGLYELIERDSFMRAWYDHLPVEKLDISSPYLPGTHLVRIPCEVGLEVVVALIEQNQPPFTAVGLAARKSLDQAVSSASLEAIASQLCLREWLAEMPALPSYPPQTLEDHARVHAVYRYLIKSREPWLQATQVAQASLETIDISNIIERVPEIFWVDLTTQDVASAGLRVVRVLSPNFMPLRCSSKGLEQVYPHPLA